jgi:Arc/MetJ-type ribon-helix-helix transcriptional regulator
MEVVLSPELERKVRERVGGSYGSPSDVVEEALKAFFGPESISTAEIENLNRHIDAGLSDVRGGNTIEGELAREAALQRLKSRRQI